MRNRVEICGINTAKLPTLKNDRMMQLLEQARQGDASAREQLIYGNLRLDAAAHPQGAAVPEEPPHLPGDHGYPVGGKPHPLPEIEVVDGLHEADAAHLKEVVGTFAAAL